jgi:hypothetical protein
LESSAASAEQKFAVATTQVSRNLTNTGARDHFTAILVRVLPVISSRKALSLLPSPFSSAV